MRISVYSDGGQHQVSFSGTVDIAYANGEEVLAIRAASDDFKLWGVAVDASAIESRKLALAKVFAREREALLDFQRMVDQEISRGSCGGSRVRAGYD